VPTESSGGVSAGMGRVTGKQCWSGTFWEAEFLSEHGVGVPGHSRAASRHPQFSGGVCPGAAQEGLVSQGSVRRSCPEAATEAAVEGGG